MHLARLICGSLLLGSLIPAQAAIYKVGPGGTHATIQAAIDAALANPGDDEIRVHTGTYAETIAVPATMTSDTLTIRGGFLDGYVAPVRNGAQLTIVQPPIGARATMLQPSGGTLVLDALTFTGSHTPSVCAGMGIIATGTAQVTIQNAYVHDNIAQGNGAGVFGGAACVTGQDSAHIVLSHVAFSHNMAQVASGTGGASGGAVSLYCDGHSVCDILDSSFDHNRVEAKGGQAKGAAITASGAASSAIRIARTRFEAQEIGGAPNLATGLSVEIDAYDDMQAEVTQCEFRGGGVTPLFPSTAELFAWPHNQAFLVVDNSVFSHSPARALELRAYDDTQLWVAQLTLADNAQPSTIDSPGTRSPLIYDNLFADPGLLPIYLGAQATTEHNLFQSPGFVAPSLYDYSLRGAGAATNAGSTTHSVGDYDVTGAPRIQDGVVDIGAYESSDRVFADRFNL